MRLFRAITTTALLFVYLTSSTAPVSAAEFFSNNIVNIPASDNPKDAYVVGSTINIDAPIQGDLTVAGGNITVANKVETNLLAAGGTITVKGEVGATARIAGGTLLLTNKIGRDLVVLGGETTLADSASIGGDVVINGGTIVINAPVSGKVLVNGGKVTLNSSVGGSVEGEMTALTLGPNAKITGDLRYRSGQEVSQDAKAMVNGETDFQRLDPSGKTTSSAGIASVGFFYSLFASLLTALALIYLLRRNVNQTLIRAQDVPLKSLFIGLLISIIVPPVLIVLLIFTFWLGLVATLAYLLAVVVSYFIAQIYLGWWFLRWWLGRNHQVYELDWRAAVVGVLATSILWLVPVIGWIGVIGLWWMTLGALVQHLIAAQQANQVG